MYLRNLVFSALIATATVAFAQERSDDLSQWDETIFPPDAPIVVRGDEGDLPEVPFPHATPGPIPPDPTVFFIAPAPQLSMRAGYTAYGNPVKHGGGVGVVVFLDAGSIGALIDANVAGGQDGFGYTDGDVRIRLRRAIDKNRESNDVHDTASRYYWGFGGDIGWRGGEQQDNYLKVQPVAIIGTMRAFKNRRTKEVKCVIHAFAKAGVGVYDNQVQTPEDRKWAMNWDTWVRPMVGAEFMASCKNIDVIGNPRLIADAQHVFTFGPAGDTTRARLQYSQTWGVGKSKHWQVGYFTKGEVTHEWGGNFTADDPANKGRTVPAFFGGVEVRW